MAITTSAITSSFKKQLLGGVQNIANGGNTLKLALYTDSAVIGPGLASYTTTGEVGNSGDYSAGGKTFRLSVIISSWIVDIFCLSSRIVRLVERLYVSKLSSKFLTSVLTRSIF